MTRSVRAMSYNVRYDNPQDGANAWEHRRDEVANAIQFHGPAVVGLQEAMDHQLEDVRERVPGYEWLAAGREEPEVAGENAAVGYHAGRFDRESAGQFWLSETPDEPSRGWDADLPRVVRHVRLTDRTTGRSFLHVNTHFDHRGPTAREESAALLGERLPELADGDPVVLTGDLNCRTGSVPYRLLTDDENDAPLTDSHYRTADRHYGPTTTMTDFHNLIPEKKIDFVFVSPDVDVYSHGCCSNPTGDGRYPSDHLPILTRLRLPKADA